MATAILSPPTGEPVEVELPEVPLVGDQVFLGNDLLIVATRMWRERLPRALVRGAPVWVCVLYLSRK